MSRLLTQTFVSETETSSILENAMSEQYIVDYSGSAHPQRRSGLQTLSFHERMLST